MIGWKRDSKDLANKVYHNFDFKEIAQALLKMSKVETQQN